MPRIFFGGGSKGNFKRNFKGNLKEKVVHFQKKAIQGKFEFGLQTTRFQFALKDHIHGFQMKTLSFNDDVIR